jgi:hypothetical protein
LSDEENGSTGMTMARCRKLCCTRQRNFPTPHVAVLLAIVLAFPATGISQQTGRPDLNGVWATALLVPDDPRWRIEDIACARTGCSLEGFRYLQTLLGDPQNSNRTVKELFFDMLDHEKARLNDLLTPAGRKEQADYDPADDPAVDCTPDGDGLRHQILAPTPIQIEQNDDTVIIRYEYWNAERTVYMDGRKSPPDTAPTRLGYSIGHYDGGALVIETAAMLPNLIGVPGGGALRPDPGARFVERYELSDDGERLDLVLTIIDPVHFRRPYENQRSYLLAPDWELAEYVCEALTGEF